MGRFDRLPGIDDSQTTRRNVAVGGIYALAGCVGIGALSANPDEDGGTGQGETQTPADNTEDSTPTDTADAETATETESETPTEPDSIGEMAAVSANTDWLLNATTVQGNGQTVTDTFPASRYTTFVYQHDGSSNFIVKLIDEESGDLVDVLVNKIGAVSGAVGIGLPDREYFLDINADGDWSIELGEPSPDDDNYGIPPGRLSGGQSDVYGWIEIDGRVTVSGQHDGDSNFQVLAWDEANRRGIPDDVIFNEIGTFDGETSVRLSGLFFLEVVADGNYTVEIEE